MWNAIAEGAIRYGFIHTPEDEINVYVEEIKQKQKHNLNTLLGEITDKLRRDSLEYISPKIHFIQGHPRIDVPKFAEKNHADLVVMGTVARTDLPGLFMGNTAESILNQLDCSVLAVKPQGFVTPVIQDD